MAYVNFDEGMATVAVPLRDLDDAASPVATLSALEWSVVAIARRDSLASLERPGRLSVALGRIFGNGRQNPRLADERLEALRRVSVLAWHRGYAISNSELSAFLAAGFSLDQYEVLQNSIGRARAAGQWSILQ